MKDNPTADQVRGRLSYDKDSGKITRGGVVWRDKYNRLEAYIYLNNKQISLGLFNSPDAASAAYFQAKCNYHPEWRANRMEVCHNG